MHKYHASGNGTAGCPKKLQRVILLKAHMVNATVLRNSTNDGAQTSTTLLNYLHECGHTENWAATMANLYYQNSTVMTAIMRVQTLRLAAGDFSAMAGLGARWWMSPLGSAIKKASSTPTIRGARSFSDRGNMRREF